MDFSGCPSFSFSNTVFIQQTNTGSWAGVHLEGEAVSYSDRDMQGAIAISLSKDNSYGLWAVIDPLRKDIYRYSIDYSKSEVHIEGSTRTLPLNEFMNNAVRKNTDGKTLCSFMQPLNAQFTRCYEIKGSEYHLLDIAEAAKYFRASNEGNDKFDVGVYDILSSGIDDGQNFLDIITKVNAKNVPTHKLLSLDTKIGGDWQEIRSFDQYLQAPIRALFGTYMEDLLGEFPLERVSRLQMPHGYQLSLLIENHADLISSTPPFEGGNIIPGYKTSEVAHFRGDEFDAIVFSDEWGTYAYAWPTPNELINQPATFKM